METTATEAATGANRIRFICFDLSDIFSCTRIMNHDLLLGFRKLGIECPFPQVDVHIEK